MMMLMIIEVNLDPMDSTRHRTMTCLSDLELLPALQDRRLGYSMEV